ncbi:uncharacterized protein SPPG_07991 [Spizellomyces punctatus DAOM BR117]|uniref:Uncharacterized protein n=1 Tax=Spizellomyces punctatus (strain DAOM BR117) TaxID=645134 RepID=A0A0L0H5K0_SPIPD|nr:uncharacterized protein SPPG_07991 [Spizellomyces punctatus DAOM BR117]KNC96785.1 hypothetical protein SPPG_07991 [Spizellomyces punctatus DAOM BR117]|eukprot:XP_016604825.1 hypothetical protein SPPG_07991 [Spizellomyces punctatus DAOM BR117]
MTIANGGKRKRQKGSHSNTPNVYILSTQCRDWVICAPAACLSGERQQAPQSQEINKVKRWTEEKREFLRSLVRKHGERGKWNEITAEFNQVFGHSRSQLFDYWRKVLKRQPVTTMDEDLDVPVGTNNQVGQEDDDVQEDGEVEEYEE